MAEYNHGQIGQLVLKAQAGDSDAFAQLYGLTYKHVYNYAARYLKDEYLAQDAVQDTYIHALKYIRNIKDPTLFVAWINQIAFHTCYDMCKKADGNYGLTDPEQLELALDENVDHNPADALEQIDERRIVNQAVESLPFHEKQVIVLRYFNDMKIDELAKTLSLSKSTIKRYLKSAREHLEIYLRGRI